MGHLIPLAEFARRLTHLHHDISITFTTLSSSSNNAEQSILSSLPPSITSLTLPPPSLSDLPSDLKIESLISLSLSRSLPSLRHIISSLPDVSALVVDLFGTDAFDVAEEFNIPKYIFFPSTAMTLSLFKHLPDLDSSVSCEYRDSPDPIRLPGCVPLRGSDLLDPVQDRTNDAYKWVLHHSKRYGLADGIFLNSFEDLEPGPIRALTEPGSKPPVYPVGPLVRTGGSEDSTGCLEWLDRQPSGSVLFVCFGSGGTLSVDQLTELAAGLEMSGQRFLWAVKSPSKVSNSSFFSAASSDDPVGSLPEGFVERTKGRGMMVPSWAPQSQVLAHTSTGGFVSHCGWNSTLESVVYGVPLIVWPLYAEQKMNAVNLIEQAKIAIRPTTGEDGVVRREEVSRIVRALMEGEEGMGVRSRVKELQERAKKTLSEGGSSCKALGEVALKLRQNSNHNNNNSSVANGVSGDV
ncbi:UDP-glycosyltransferase 72B1 [Acorus gramineus]|uniref:Glycosyltransferase n=1 Tax=Acorus gramineus TaxID=55184 RepID=A0AAV9AXI9_ACOGR|nr:UDP-glycosyltransferase 72B1 [Acorus gramineus]